jgi:hypothetical protein
MKRKAIMRRDEEKEIGMIDQEHRENDNQERRGRE